MELVTVKLFDSITSLALVRAVLEEEEIPCFVKDEYMGTVYGNTGVQELRIKLQVEDKDVEKAINILIEKGYAKPEDYQPDKTMLWLTGIFEKITSFFKGEKNRR